jgi:hypothetical protein
MCAQWNCTCSTWPMQKYFSHPSFSYLLICNPTHKTETWTANKWGLLVANHLDQSLWWADQKHWSIVRSYLLHSLLQLHRVAVPFARHGKMCLMMSQKNALETKPACFEFSSSNCTVQDHILSTTGDALSGVELADPVLQSTACIIGIHWCRIWA